MLRVDFDEEEPELLVEGPRADYDKFGGVVRQALTTGLQSAIPVFSAGETRITRFVVRCGSPPNRVWYEQDQIVFSIAPNLQDAFMSFIEFPADDDLPDSPIQYHHHYDGWADDGTYVAADSLPVVFGLVRN